MATIKKLKNGEKPMNNKSRLKVVSAEARPSSLASRAIGQVTPSVLNRHITNLYKVNGSLAPRGDLRVPPKIMPRSPSIGMGMELSFRNRMIVISIDDKYLSEVLNQEIDPRMHHHTARYFILSAAGHAIVKDTAHVKSFERDGPELMMTRAWQWAAGVALEEMNLRSETEDTIVKACRTVCRSREENLATDYLFYTDVAVQHRVDPPKLRPVEPWVEGLSFPLSRDDIRSLRPSVND